MSDDKAEDKSIAAQSMRLNVVATALALALVFAIFTLLFSTWSRFTEFGDAFWGVFHSLHPNAYPFDMVESSVFLHIVGTLFDTFYSIIDGFILGSLFSVFYNLFLPKRK